MTRPVDPAKKSNHHHAHRGERFKPTPETVAVATGLLKEAGAYLYDRFSQGTEQVCQGLEKFNTHVGSLASNVQRLGDKSEKLLTLYQNYQTTLNNILPGPSACLLMPTMAAAVYQRGHDYLNQWLLNQFNEIFSGKEILPPTHWPQIMASAIEANQPCVHEVEPDPFDIFYYLEAFFKKNEPVRDVASNPNQRLSQPIALLEEDPPVVEGETTDQAVLWPITYEVSGGRIANVRRWMAESLAYSKEAIYDFATLGFEKKYQIIGGLQEVHIEPRHTSNKILHYKIADSLAPLPTPIETDGLPTIVYEVIEPKGAKIFWDKTAGLYYVKSPMVGENPQAIKLKIHDRWNFPWLQNLEPMSFDVTATSSPAKLEDLSAGTRKIFEEAMAMGDEKRWGKHALTPAEQLQWIAYQLSLQWKGYKLHPPNMKEVVEQGVAGLKLLHTPEGPEYADCQLANIGEFYLAARAYGFNVVAVVGRLNIDAIPGQRDAFTDPPHAWVEFYDPATKSITILDATPSTKPPTKIPTTDELEKLHPHLYPIAKKIDFLNANPPRVERNTKLQQLYSELSDTLTQDDANTTERLALLSQIAEVADTLPAEERIDEQVIINQRYVFTIAPENSFRVKQLDRKTKIHVYERSSLQSTGKGRYLGYILSPSYSHTFVYERMLKDKNDLHAFHNEDTSHGGSSLEWHVEIPPPHSNEVKNDSEQRRNAYYELKAPLVTKDELHTLIGAFKHDGKVSVQLTPTTTVNLQIYGAGVVGGRWPFHDAMGNELSLAELTHLEFKKYEIKNKEDKVLFYGFYNAERGVLMQDPRSCSEIYDSENGYYLSLRWSHDGPKRRILAYQTERDVLSYDKQTHVHHGLDMAHSLFTIMKGQAIDETNPKQRALLKNIYQRLLEQPPELLAYGGSERNHADLIPLYYIITETKRLGIAQEVEDEIIQGRQIKSTCKDPNYDPPLNVTRSCTATESPRIRLTELEAKVFELSPSLFHDFTPSNPWEQTWVDRLKSHFKVEPRPPLQPRNW